MKKYLMIGQIVKPQGVRGEVKVAPATDDPERFCELPHVYLDEKGEKQLKVLSGRVREGYAFLTLEGISDRDQAEGLRNVFLYIDRENAVKLPEGRYYISDLIGMDVKDEAGNALGKLTDVFQAGGNDVYEVRGNRVFRFPALKRALVSVDVENAVMVLDASELSRIAVYDDED